jgi:hypothetical protein
VPAAWIGAGTCSLAALAGAMEPREVAARRAFWRARAAPAKPLDRCCACGRTRWGPRQAGLGGHRLVGARFSTAQGHGASGMGPAGFAAKGGPALNAPIACTPLFTLLRTRGPAAGARPASYSKSAEGSRQRLRPLLPAQGTTLMLDGAGQRDCAPAGGSWLRCRVQGAKHPGGRAQRHRPVGGEVRLLVCCTLYLSGYRALRSPQP